MSFSVVTNDWESNAKKEQRLLAHANQNNTRTCEHDSKYYGFIVLNYAHRLVLFKACCFKALYLSGEFPSGDSRLAVLGYMLAIITLTAGLTGSMLTNKLTLDRVSPGHAPSFGASSFSQSAI